jgi:hypothetical protein
VSSLNLNEQTEASIGPVASFDGADSPFSRFNLLSRIKSVLKYAQAFNYEGYDLFDGLNSQLLKSTVFYRSRYFRLAWIQFCKKSPVNVRPLLGVSKGFNPKGGALFLMGLIQLFEAYGEETYSNEAYILFQRLRHNVLTRTIGNAWGYNFDWQARAFFVPEGTPNLVTSVFVGRALIAYYRCFNDPQALELALGVTDFILSEMICHEDELLLCFRYIPAKDAEVHNANLLAASYLAETLCFLPESRQRPIRQKILKAVRFSIADINPDGSWPYGTLSFHRWVDNFHTGFNIESLQTIQDCLKLDDYAGVLDQVIEYYLDNMFDEAGLPKYYNDQLYPVDVHVLAESIIILRLLRQRGYQGNASRRLLIEKSLIDLLVQFQDVKGYFYYQKSSRGWNKIPYIRWGQAWMFYALAGCVRV